MYLADREILAALAQGEIRIEPFDPARLQPASYDLLLGNHFITTEAHTTPYMDPARGLFPETREVEVPDGESFVLHPGISVLGRSKDFFGSDRYLIQLSGKSSLARVGLLVHNTAAHINPGHYLQITLELCNLSPVPILLRPGMAIGQITFAGLTSIPERSYRERGRFAANNWEHFVAPPS